MLQQLSSDPTTNSRLGLGLETVMVTQGAQEEWANTPKERCEKLVRVYSSRLQEDIAAYGCCTKY